MTVYIIVREVYSFEEHRIVNRIIMDVFKSDIEAYEHCLKLRNENDGDSKVENFYYVCEREVQ